ncbi:MAG: urea ABC transporter ATP-binding subunit UrtE [Burkholderiaceae bacterium]|nr:MAG: urea ABC transporter ATP-binding subunit UrtE [Burkholderiaceae bacterium]
MLKVDSLEVGYGESVVIPGVSLSVGERDAVGVIGRNGMGKTTLLKAIVGLLPASAGRIEFGGVDITRLPTYERVRLGIGFVPQGRLLFPQLTVEENLLTGLESRRIDGVPGLVFELFPVLREMRARKAGNLSGGQQQMVAIGRALATGPRLLILDEPTEGLQPSLIKEIGVALVELRRATGCAMLVTEQVLSFATAVSDRMIVLERGTVVKETGTDARDVEAVKAFLTV